jgi:PKD-like domain/Ig-like domain CHU_C associated/CHRD domain/Secretion system C-terminal sorting domain
MNKLYVRNLLAFLYALVLNMLGISSNTSLLTDTPTGYPVSKNQNNKRLWLLPRLMAVIMILLLTIYSKAQTYTFNMNGANVAVPNSSTGTGSITVVINTSANTMRIFGSFSGLTGNSTSAHIHAITPSPNTGASGIATPSFLASFPLGVLAGTYDNTFDMTLSSSYSPAFITANSGTIAGAFLALQTALAQSKAYFDIHTSAFAAGEIRAFPTVNVITVGFNQTQPTCDNSNNGGLRAIPSGTCGTGYQYLWTPGGATTDTISNLAPGTYNVRVVCGTDTVNKSVTLTASTVVPAPTTVGSIVDYTGSKTISQLDVIPLPGATINFYYTATGGAALAGTTPVVDDTTYFISQTIGGCESNPRKQITVNRIANDSIVLCNPATVAALTATPQAGNTTQWFTTATGGTALASTASIPSGTNTYYVQESGGTESTLYTYPNGISRLMSLELDDKDTIFYGTYYDGERIYKARPDGTNSTRISQGVFTIGSPVRSLAFEKNNTNRYLYFADMNAIRRLDVNTLTKTIVDSSNVRYPAGQISRDSVNNRLYFAGLGTFIPVLYVKDLTSGLVTALDSLPSTSSINVACYSAATNSVYFNNAQTGKIYRKNLTTGVRTDSISTTGVGSIYEMPDGKLLIVGNSFIATVNPDLTGFTPLFTSIALGGILDAQVDSKGNIVFIELYKIKKFTIVNSNRVPVTVIVNPTANVLPTADTTVCNGSTIPAINFATTTSSGTVTYSWTNNRPSIGLAASGTGNIASFVATNLSTTAATTATIIVTPTITNAGISCEGVKDTFLITVNPTLVVDVIPNQVVCNGSPTTPASFDEDGGPRRAVVTIVYNWTNNTPSIGLAASGTGNISSFTAINNGNAPVTATIVITPSYTFNGVTCIGTPRTFTITVNPTATVDTVANQIVCNGANTTAINFNSPTSGGTIVYNWTNDDASIGLATSGTDSIASFVATNSGTAPITATITVTPTFTNGVRTCIGTPRTFTITVNPTATVDSISNKVACNGSVVAAVTASTPNTGGTVTYAWANNNTAIGLAASGTGTIPSFTATNTGTTPITATVTITPTLTNGAVSCVGTAFSYTITVNPPPIFNTIANQVACNSSSTSIVPFSTSLTGGTSAFAWTNNNTAIGLAASGTGSLPSFTATNNTTAPISGTISVVMTYTNAGLSCVSLPQTFTYTVNPTPTAVATPSSQTICSANPITTIVLTGAVSGTTYNWTRDNTANVTGIAASGAGNIAGTLTNTTFAPVTVTFTITPTANGCPGTPITATVLVNPTPDATATPSSQTICSGFAITPIVFTGNVAGTTFNWTRNNTATVTGITASGSGNITGTLTNTTFTPVTVTFTITPTANGCPGTPITATVLVNPTPNAIATPSTQTICSGNTITTIVLTGNVAGTTFAWTRDNIASVTGIAASGAGNISGTLTNTTALPVTVTFTITPTANGCVGTPITATVIVNPRPVMTALPASQTICNGVTITPIVFASTTPGTTYTWTRDNSSGTTAPGGIQASGSGPSITGFMINTTNAPITVTFTITPTASGCVGTPVTATVTIQPTTTAVATPARQVSCSGTPITTINLTSPVAGTVYSWTRDNVATATGMPASGTGNTITGTLTTTSTTQVVVTFTITPSINGCVGPSIIATDTINPTPSVNTPTNQVLCNGAATTAVSFTSPVAGTSFNWTNNTPSIGLAASGTGNIPSFTAVNTSNVPVTATITVTPIVTGTGCSGTPVTFTITVNPTANVGAVPNQTLCTGVATAAINFTGTVAGTTYSWTNNTPSIGLAASGTGNIPSFVAVNNTPTAVTATITVTPNSGVGCVGTPITFTITVNGNSVTPTGATSSVTTNCGPTTTTLTVQGGALGTGASWKWYTGSCGGTLVGTGASITVPVNATTTYYVRAEGTCNTTTCASVTVTINTVPTISIAAAPYTALTPLLKTNLTATVTPVAAGNVVEWYKDNGPIAIATGLSITNINVDQVGSYIARVTTAQGCTASSNVVVIKDSATSQLFVYPNPNNGQFKIRYYLPENVISVVRKVVIIDSKGALVFAKRISVQTRWGAMDVDIRNAAQGSYFIKILDVNEQPIVGARVQVLR